MRKFNIFKGPVLTEKTYKAMENKNKYVFDVVPNANKTEIKKVFEELFEAKVASVNTFKKAAKTKRVGRFIGRKNHRKIAIITLKPGETLEVMSDEAAAQVNEKLAEPSDAPKIVEAQEVKEKEIKVDPEKTTAKKEAPKTTTTKKEVPEENIASKPVTKASKEEGGK